MLGWILFLSGCEEVHLQKQEPVDEELPTVALAPEEADVVSTGTVASWAKSSGIQPSLPAVLPLTQVGTFWSQACSTEPLTSAAVLMRRRRVTPGLRFSSSIGRTEAMPGHGPSPGTSGTAT